jgi:hypothetical protein
MGIDHDLLFEDSVRAEDAELMLRVGWVRIDWVGRDLGERHGNGSYIEFDDTERESEHRYGPIMRVAQGKGER